MRDWFRKFGLDDFGAFLGWAFLVFVLAKLWWDFGLLVPLILVLLVALFAATIGGIIWFSDRLYERRQRSKKPEPPAATETSRPCRLCNQLRPFAAFPDLRPGLKDVCQTCHQSPLRCAICNEDEPASRFSVFFGSPTNIPGEFRNVSLQRCDTCLASFLCSLCYKVVPFHAYAQPYGTAYGSNKPYQYAKRRNEERTRRVPLKIYKRHPPPDGICPACCEFTRLAESHETKVRDMLANPNPPASPEHLTFGTSMGAPVQIDADQLARHCYIIGGTGSGKSVLLKNLAEQLLAQGAGVGVLDPHGDLAQDVAALLPRDRLGDLVYLDPAHPDAPSFNLLAADFEPHKLTADMLAVFRLFFGDAWGQRMENLLRHSLLTLLFDRVNEPHSIADLRLLLLDDSYRAEIIDRLEHGDLEAREIAEFWQLEFPGMSKDAPAPILNRLSALLVPGSPLKRMFSQTTNEIDATAIMNSGKVLLVNLSRGALGEQPANLLGGLMLTALAQAALARQSLPVSERRPFYLFADEFQTFADIPTTSTILTEARKYNLRLLLAHQTTSQVRSELMANITGNVRTVVAYQVNAEDGMKLTRLMGRPITITKTGDRFDPVTYAEEQRQQNLTTLGDGLTDAMPGDPGRLYLGPKASTAYKQLTSTEPPCRPQIEGRQETFPNVQDFRNLQPLNGFIMTNTAATTRPLKVPLPSSGAPDNLSEWYARRKQQSADSPTEEPPRHVIRRKPRPQPTASAPDNRPGRPKLYSRKDKAETPKPSPETPRNVASDQPRRPETQPAPQPQEKPKAPEPPRRDDPPTDPEDFGF